MGAVVLSAPGSPSGRVAVWLGMLSLCVLTLGISRVCEPILTASVQCNRVRLNCLCCVCGYAFALKQTRSIPAVKPS